MADQLINAKAGDTSSALFANPDGTYSTVPLTTTADGQVVLALNEMGLAGEGEDMVVIAADDNLDMATLENLIASGAVTTVTGENGSEYLQFVEPGADGTQLIELSADQMQLLDPASKAYFSAAGLGAGAGFVALAGQPTGVTYRCPSCPAMYANANAFTKHMREKHFVKVYTCRQCEEFFETLSQLFLHARRSHVDPKKPKRNPANYKFHCDQCNYMTNNGGTMEHHKRAHSGEKPYVCDVCSKRFAQKANMKTHRNRHIHRDKIFRCETCNKAFSSYDIYLAHLRTREHELREHFAMMASSQLALDCLGCATTFDSIYNLNKHTRSCRIVRTLQTKFRCLPCNAYVTDVASLKAHVKAHEGSQIISCPVCGERGFPGFNQLNHHITRAHALKVNRRHVCRYCESTFEVKKDLDLHIRSMHADERNARQSRGAVGRLKCRYAHCEFTTNSIMLLDRHHDQHRRQEEDGEDLNDRIMNKPMMPSSNRTVRYSAAMSAHHNRRRPVQTTTMSMAKLHLRQQQYQRNRAAGIRATASGTSVRMSNSGTARRGNQIENDDDDDDDDNEEALDQVLEDGNVTRRTITLIKSKKGTLRATNGQVKDKPLANGTALVSPNTSQQAGKPAEDVSVDRRASRARRMPAWYKDYDTEVTEKGAAAMAREEIQAQLPPGIELEDPSDLVKTDIPTEEWNIVVYEDEDDDEMEDEEEEEVGVTSGLAEETAAGRQQEEEDRVEGAPAQQHNAGATGPVQYEVVDIGDQNCEPGFLMADVANTTASTADIADVSGEALG